MNVLLQNARYALREFRVGLQGFGIFLACLSLGVATMMSVGSLTTMIETAIAENGRNLLGGDVEVHTRGADLPGEVTGFLQQSGVVTRIRRLVTMSQLPEQDAIQLTMLKAIEAEYPLYGHLQLEPESAPEVALSRRSGHWGALIDVDLQKRFDIKTGSIIAIGDLEYQVRGVILHQPDAAVQGIKFAPTVIVGGESLDDSGLIKAGSIVRYDYRVKLDSGVDPELWRSRFEQRFGSDQYQIRTRNESVPGLDRILERVGLFLSVISVTALVVGGVGIGNAVKSYLARKREVIATLKCLGATRSDIFGIYFIQILLLTTIGAVIGVFVGMLVPWLLSEVLQQWWSLPVKIRIYPLPLVHAVLFGFCIALLFSIWPLATAVATPAAGLFRSRVVPQNLMVGGRYVFISVLITLMLLLMTVSTVRNPLFVASCFLTLGAVLWFLGGLAKGLKWISKKIPLPVDPRIRLAVTNIHRPGMPLVSIVISLGIGLSLFVAVASLHSNVAAQISRELPKSSPTHFFIDVQPYQLSSLQQEIGKLSGITHFENAAMVSARITGINGQGVDAWPQKTTELQNTQRIAVMPELPPGNSVIAGQWWPVDYNGPPLLSLSEHTAERLGLTVGDKLTLTANGRTLTGKLAAIRRVDWGSMSINFRFVASPNTFAGQPQTHVATVSAESTVETALYRLVAGQFPNVSLINVREIMSLVQSLLTDMGYAINAAAAVTILAGALVLAGAIAAGQYQRIYDAVILKVLGARSMDVLVCYIFEYFVVSAVTGVIAVLLGGGAAYFIVSGLMELPWVLPTGVMLATVGVSIALVIGLGLVGTWQALAKKPARVLRTE